MLVAHRHGGTTDARHYLHRLLSRVYRGIRWKERLLHLELIRGLGSCADDIVIDIVVLVEGIRLHGQ